MAKAKTYTSPKGFAVFPRLNTPDTKFDAAGVYKTDLALETSLESTQKLISFLDKRFDAYEAELTKANRGKKPRMNPVPYSEELDDDGNPTGRTLFKYSSKASGITKAGKAWSRDMKLFDAKGKPTSAQIWGGSEIKVSFSVGEYKAGANCGIKCYLEAVQVIELVSGSGGSASEYGFGEEDGYEDDGDDAGSDDNGSSEDGDDGADF